MIEEFKTARRVATPLIAIKTLDPAVTIQEICKSIPTFPHKKGEANADDAVVIVEWDVLKGWRSKDELGETVISTLIEQNTELDTQNPTDCLVLASQLPERSILVMKNAHRFLLNAVNVDGVTVSQALCNMRDEFKVRSKSVVLLGPHFNIPLELQQDIFQIDEALPNDAQLTAKLKSAAAAQSIALTPEIEAKSVDALRGLSMFPVEQTIYMSMTNKGTFDVSKMWDRKKQLIDDTPGLSVWRGEESFKDLGGVSQIKKFIQLILKGKKAPSVIVFLDEIEKSLAGATGYSGDSGVSKDQLQLLLTEMENNRYQGMILIGPPGTAKSAIAKAAGNEAGIPTIILDLGGTKGGIVGESEAKIRYAMKIIKSIGGGNALFLGSCNQITELPPELKRRFNRGTFFFDLPTLEERIFIWDIYAKKHKIDRELCREVIDDNWTGAEIQVCAEMADEYSFTPREASEFIVPVFKSSSEEIRKLRAHAHERFLSASYPGLYRDKSKNSSLPTERRLNTSRN